MDAPTDGPLPNTRKHLYRAGLATTLLLLLAAPAHAQDITVFVVRAVGGGKTGCATGTFDDYVVIDQTAVGGDRTTMAHEIGHACGLAHRPDQRSNLMFPSELRPTTNLTRWQKCRLRGSRYVTRLG